MTVSKKLWERIEFPLAFLFSIAGGLVAFLFVWLIGIALECSR
jgi:hypothetical protein